MANSHCKIKKIQRTEKKKSRRTGKIEIKKGRSAVAAAAYRAGPLGQPMTDPRTGHRYDYTKKNGVYYSKIIGWEGTREELWGQAELAEKRKDAITAREIVVALPKELSEEERIRVADEYAKAIQERLGCAVDYAIHLPDKKGSVNWHIHLMITSRVTDGDTLGAKTSVLDNKFTGGQEVRWIRQRWEEAANGGLARMGVADRVDMRSLRRRGILKARHIHVGPKATYEASLGHTVWQIEHNKMVDELNARIMAEKKSIWNERDKLAEYQRQIDELETEGKRLLAEAPDDGSPEVADQRSAEDIAADRASDEAYKKMMAAKGAINALPKNRITVMDVLAEDVMYRDAYAWGRSKADAAVKAWEGSHIGWSIIPNADHLRLLKTQRWYWQQAVKREEELAEARKTAPRRALIEEGQRIKAFRDARQVIAEVIAKYPEKAKYLGNEIHVGLKRDKLDALIEQLKAKADEAAEMKVRVAEKLDTWNPLTPDILAAEKAKLMSRLQVPPTQ